MTELNSSAYNINKKKSNSQHMSHINSYTNPETEHRRNSLRHNLLSRSRSVGINSNPSWIRRKIQCRSLWINRRFRTVRDVELNSEFPHTKYQPCAMDDPGENKVCAMR